MSIDYRLSTAPAASATTDCVVAGVYADKSLTPAAQALDAASGGRIAALVERGDASGKIGQTALLLDLPGVTAPRVLLVGLGEAGKFGAPQYIKVVGDAIRALKSGPVGHAYLTLSEVPVQGRDAAWAIRQAVMAAAQQLYRYTATLGEKSKGKGASSLATVEIAGDNATALHQGRGIASGTQYARELGNLPPNICNPGYLAAQAAEFAAAHANAECEVLDRAQMEALGMGSLLAVARGSANPPKLIVLKWNNGGDSRPYVLVGKGITFDTGGINLKTAGGIEEMKYDMCGGATVIGTFVAAVEMGLPINLVTIVPAVENMPDADAYRPSDVITSMSGKTIEVGNTDAGARLIRCAALPTAQRFDPAALIDVATLTGACVIALGKHASGLMSKHDDLAAELLAAGETSGDRAWRLPIWDDYQSALDSAFADVANIGGKYGGAITAGCFLSRFAEGQRWAHLDIAGVSHADGKLGMASGRPVGMLTHWLLDRVH